MPDRLPDKPHTRDQSERANLPAGRQWTTADLDPGMIDALVRGLPASRLWSLLLGVIEQRAAARDPGQLQKQWSTDRFVAPCAVDPRTLLDLDQLLFATAGEFEAIELSPVAPLGACSILAPTSQNRTVATIRGTEVVSDPTNVLALECARRLRADASRTIRLATSHRCVRAQPVPQGAGFAAHFRLFCLASAGHETRDQAFLTGAFVEHVTTHLRSLERLERHGYRFGERRVTLLSSPERRPLAGRVAAGLPDVAVVHEPLEKTYYDGLRFMISTEGQSGPIPLIDGGAFDWVARLASNHKLVFVASAIGSQLVAHLFRAGGGGA